MYFSLFVLFCFSSHGNLTVLFFFSHCVMRYLRDGQVGAVALITLLCFLFNLVGEMKDDEM